MMLFVRIRHENACAWRFDVTCFLHVVQMIGFEMAEHLLIPDAEQFPADLNAFVIGSISFRDQRYAQVVDVTPKTKYRGSETPCLNSQSLVRFVATIAHTYNVET